MTIQVKHEPRKHVIIHEMGQYDSVQQLVDLMTAGIPQGALPPTLRWVDGIVLWFNAIPPTTDFMAKEREKGILHWDHVSFTRTKKFQEQVVSKNNIVVDIVDVSKNETFKAVSKFLKKK